MFFSPIHGSQWLPSTVWLPALFKISSEERNSYRFGNPNVPFWVIYTCKLELVNYQIMSTLIQLSAIKKKWFGWGSILFFLKLLQFVFAQAMISWPPPKTKFVINIVNKNVNILYKNVFMFIYKTLKYILLVRIFSLQKKMC